MVTKQETEVLIRAGEIWSHFSERTSKLPKNLQGIFFRDLETAMENRLRVLEKYKNENTIRHY